MESFMAMFSNPIDSSTNDEIKELIKSVLGIFTAYYVKGYTLGLVKKAIEDAASEPGPEWKLLERPSRTVTYKEGWVIKEAGYFMKSMQKRYFVVRPDYLIDYYLSEADAKKVGGKPRGTISLCGYSVNEDANNGTIQRLTKLAEKMGLDVSGLPQPKKFPERTIEMFHNRRENWYVQLEDPEEYKQWLEQLKSCAWRGYGYKNQDKIHIAAFEEAISETRSQLGRWGYSSYGGTEEQILADLISDELEYDIMGRIYSKIQGPWAVRNKIRETVVKAINKMVMAAVSPAWKAMSSTVDTLRPQIEPKIKENVGPIGEAKKELINKIQDACMSVIDPAIRTHVIPHLSKIIAIIQDPMISAFSESYKMFDKDVIGSFTMKDNLKENKEEFRNLDYFPHSWKMYDVTRIADAMSDPLYNLRIVFSDISPWSLIYTAHDTLRSKMDNAIYTFETRLITDETTETMNADPALVHKIKHQVLEDYRRDGRQAITLFHSDIIKQIVMPPLSAIIFPAVDTILSPIAQAIPDAMQQFFDVKQMFKRIVEGVIDESIKTALEG